MMNMNSEIVDAIIEYFDDGKEDSNELILECFMWLKENSKNTQMADRMFEWIELHGYCQKCGSKMRIETFEEVHTELLGNPVEKFDERYCPKCDIKK